MKQPDSTDVGTQINRARHVVLMVYESGRREDCVREKEYHVDDIGIWFGCIRWNNIYFS